MDAETYFLAVERIGDAYQGRLHRGDPGKAVVLENLELGADAQVTIDGQAHRLGTLVDGLTAFDTSFLKAHLDLRGQLARRPGSFWSGSASWRWPRGRTLRSSAKT